MGLFGKYFHKDYTSSMMQHVRLTEGLCKLNTNGHKDNDDRFKYSMAHCNSLLQSNKLVLC